MTRSHKESRRPRISRMWGIEIVWPEQSIGKLALSYNSCTLDYEGTGLLTDCTKSVSRNVIRGVMFGKTANAVSPTSPRVTLVKADGSTFRPSRGEANPIIESVDLNRQGLGFVETFAPHRIHTINQDTIHKGIHSPNVWCPVSMTEPTREWEESWQQLRYLFEIYKRSKCRGKYTDNTQAEFDAICKLDIQYRWSKTICT